MYLRPDFSKETVAGTVYFNRDELAHRSVREAVATLG
jgi:hypothetical protein